MTGSGPVYGRPTARIDKPAPHAHGRDGSRGADDGGDVAVDECPVAYSDLTQLDGEPTSRATPCIERTPAGRNAEGFTATPIVILLAGMAATVGLTAVGLWIGSPASVIVICSTITIMFTLAIGALRRL
jgi:hypothetical protein